MKKKRIFKMTALFLAMILCVSVLGGCSGTGEDKDSEDIVENLPKITGDFSPVEYGQEDADCDTIQWFCAAYSIYTENNNKDLGYVGGVLPEDKEWTMSAVKIALSSGWGIDGRDDVEEILTKLLRDGSSKSYKELVEEWEKDGIFDLPEEEGLASLPTGKGQASREAAYYAYQAYGEQGLIGWDYTRALQVLGDCYVADYLNFEECLNLSLPIAQALQSTFDSWDDVADSYLYGYQYWSSDEIETRFRREVYEGLKVMENSPYSVPYDTELLDTWTDAETRAAKQAEKAEKDDSNDKDDSDGLRQLRCGKNVVMIKALEGYEETEYSDEEWRVYEKPDEGGRVLRGIQLDYSLRENYEGMMEGREKSAIEFIENNMELGEYTDVTYTEVQQIKIGELDVYYIYYDYVYKELFQYRGFTSWLEINEDVYMECELEETRDVGQEMELTEDTAILEEIYENVTW